MGASNISGIGKVFAGGQMVNGGGQIQDDDIKVAFTEVMSADNHEIEVEENKKKLHLAFERKLCRFTRLQIMPLNLSIPEIIARMRMTENDIIEAVECSQDFRIINIASTVPVDDKPMDKLATFKKNKLLLFKH